MRASAFRTESPGGSLRKVDPLAIVLRKLELAIPIYSGPLGDIEDVRLASVGAEPPSIARNQRIGLDGVDIASSFFLARIPR